MNILLIEDDVDYANHFIKHMSIENINVNHMNTLDSKLISEEIKKNPDLIIMDFFYGNEDTINLYTHIKKYGIPVMYLTSNEDAATESQMLKLGVEDYVNKFKSLDIIALKIQKMGKTTRKNYNFYGNELSVEKKMINNKCKLTNNEYTILVTLIKQLGEFVSVEQIMYELWEDNLFIERNTLVVAIKRLREKLKKNQINVIIDSQAKKGYRLDENK